MSERASNKTHLVTGLNYYGSASDYASGARTNYRNSMCPASGYVTARKNCCKPIVGYQPICPAPGEIGGSDCVLYLTLFVRRVSTSQELDCRKSICPASALKICRS